MVRSNALVAFSCLLLSAFLANGQSNTPAEAATSGGKAAAYYHYSVGHLYAELASAYGNRGELFTKAVENYKLALKDDPSATFISEELSEIYIQSGRLREAVTEVEENLKQNPNDLNSRRILARIYTRLIGDQQQNKIDENMVKKALEQYAKITEKDPKDAESWLMLGRLSKVSQNSVEAEKAYKKALEIEPNNEDALTGLAMVYSDLGDTKAAADLLRKAAEKNPNPRSLTALAGTYEQMKDYTLAAETLKKALDQAPGNIDIMRALAQDLLFSDQFDEALKTYQDVAAEDPKDVQAQLRISQVYRQKRDLAKAREAADKAKELEPNNLEIQFNDVNLLEAEGKIPQAVTTLKDILAATSRKTYNQSEKTNRVLLLEKLGFLYRTNEQYDDAAATFRQIGEIDPDAAPKSAAQVVDAYRSGRLYDKAQQEADAASRKFPNDRIVRSIRASLLAEIGKTDLAVAETRKLLSGKPEDRDTYITLAQIYEKAKNFSEMSKALNSADKLSTTKEEKETIAFMRGAMFERMKNFDGAEAEFRRVLAGNPNNASALNYLGYMFADRNIRLEEARQMITKALEKEPDNAAYLDSLGWVYYRLSKLDDAEASLKRALDLMAKDPTVHDHLAEVYYQKGNIKAAVQQWQNSIQAWKSGPPSELDQDEFNKVQKKLESARVRLAQESK